MTNESQLKKILDTNDNGKPILKLIPIYKVAIHTETYEEYSELMRIYECGEWKWTNGNLPTKWCAFEEGDKDLCIEAGFAYPNSFVKNPIRRFGAGFRCFYDEEKDWEVKSVQEFYGQEKITPEMRKEINNWFDERDKQ